MEGWEIGLLVVATLVAARTLAGMMQQRQEKLVEQVQKQVDEYQEYIKANPPKKNQETSDNQQDAA